MLKVAHLRAERYLGDDLAETNAYDHLLECKVERKVAEESMEQLHKAKCAHHPTGQLGVVEPETCTRITNRAESGTGLVCAVALYVKHVIETKQNWHKIGWTN